LVRALEAIDADHSAMVATSRILRNQALQHHNALAVKAYWGRDLCKAVVVLEAVIRCRCQKRVILTPSHLQRKDRSSWEGDRWVRSSTTAKIR
jgi:hypothetical protein